MRKSRSTKMALVLAILPLLFPACASLGFIPAGEDLERVRASPNYRDGSFQNREPPSPQAAAKRPTLSTGLKLLFGKPDPSRFPPGPLPTVRTDLRALDRNRDLLVWLGHSSYYLQLGGLRILVDPVLAGHSTLLKDFPGTDAYAPGDMPDIDYLVITHDHWDHLDYATVKALRGRAGRVLTGLGVGSHLRAWGWEPAKVFEFDWDQERSFPDGLEATALTARHFSGRTLMQRKTLWTSFAVEARGRRVFLGGDSAYGVHFAAIGAERGPFDLALLECGQYNEMWRNSHMFPEETARAALDLKAAVLFAGHWGRFSLAPNAWDDGVKRLDAEAARLGLPWSHPRIGEPLYLDKFETFGKWWEGVAP